MINPCLICNISFNNKRTFNSHLFNKHQLNPKEYYDKFIKKEFEGFCGFCNKQTGFRNTTYGYKKMCSRKCYDLLLLTDERKHNVSILTKKAMQRDDVKENIKKHHSKGVSDETRKKMSILAKRKFIDHPNIKEKMYTEERNKKISESKKDVQFDENHKKNISKSLVGNSRRKNGKKTWKPDDDYKKKMSEILKKSWAKRKGLLD